jgi:hypothetical protein
MESRKRSLQGGARGGLSGGTTHAAQAGPTWWTRRGTIVQRTSRSRADHLMQQIAALCLEVLAQPPERVHVVWEPPRLSSRTVLSDFREGDAVVVASGGPPAPQARPAVHHAQGLKRLVEHLADRGVVRHIDVATLAVVCRQYKVDASCSLRNRHALRICRSEYEASEQLAMRTARPITAIGMQKVATITQGCDDNALAN